MTPAIEVKDLRFRYDETDVLKGLSFEIRKSEILGVLGPNASGKTTLIKNLAGLLQPTGGHILLDRQEINRYARRDLARKISFVPQEEEVFLPFTAEQIVLMGRAPYLGLWGFEGEEDRKKVREAMEATDVWGLRHRILQDLSGGERQRVIVARAVAQGSGLLLLDEPTSHLDIHYQMEVLDLCARLHQDRQMTLVITLHDMNLASLYCHRLLLLQEGRLFAMGTPSEVMTLENIREVFRAEVIVGAHPGTGLPYFLPQRK